MRIAPESLRRLALLCWWVPALIATAAVIAYWVTSQRWAFFIGWVNVFLGGLMTAVGGVLALTYLALAWNATFFRRRSLIRGVVAAALLGSNLPLAWICDSAEIYLRDHPRVQFFFTNSSGQPVDGLSITLDGAVHQIGAIAPSGVASISKRTPRASANVDVRVQGRQVSSRIDLVDVNDFGGRNRVVIGIDAYGHCIRQR